MSRQAIIILSFIAGLFLLAVFLTRRKNGTPGTGRIPNGPGSERIIERTTIQQQPTYVPVYYPTPSHPVRCPANTPAIQYKQRTREGCVASYSTPDGITWTLDNARSTRDCCAYSPSSPKPTGTAQEVPKPTGTAQEVRSFAIRNDGYLYPKATQTGTNS